MKRPANLTYGLEDRPPLPLTLLLGLQHTLAMSSTLVLVAVVLPSAAWPTSVAQNVVRLSMIGVGVGTILQATNRFGVGSGYLCPQLLGPAFLPASLVAVKAGGLALLYGMTIVTGLFQAILSRFLQRMRAAFPTEVVGVVVAMVGIVLIPLGVSAFFGDTVGSAQGDIATASSMVDAAASDGTELIVSLTTPMLQACLRRSRGIPVVFTLVANPVLAGAGKSNTDHLPNVSGNFVVSPFARMMRAVRECLPNARRVGTLFAPAEVNSVFYKDKLVEAAREVGIEVETVGVSTASEVVDAALSLCSTNIDAMCQISDNLTGATFAPIVQAAQRFRLPLFSFNTTHSKQGSVLMIARDYYDGGREAGLVAARVMRGENPAEIPFEIVQRTRFIINLDNARKVGLRIPAHLIEQADEVIGR